MALQNPVIWFMNKSFALKLTIGLLGLVAIQQLRQGHIGRVGIAGAGVLIIQQAHPVWNQLSGPWRIYALFAGIFAIVASLSYLTKTSLPSEFYKAALLLFVGGSILLVFWVSFPL